MPCARNTTFVRPIRVTTPSRVSTRPQTTRAIAWACTMAPHASLMARISARKRASCVPTAARAETCRMAARTHATVLSDTPARCARRTSTSVHLSRVKTAPRALTASVRSAARVLLGIRACFANKTLTSAHPRRVETGQRVSIRSMGFRAYAHRGAQVPCAKPTPTSVLRSHVPMAAHVPTQSTRTRASARVATRVRGVKPT